jgi:hypothetical protein
MVNQERPIPLTDTPATQNGAGPPAEPPVLMSFLGIEKYLRLIWIALAVLVPLAGAGVVALAVLAVDASRFAGLLG